MSRSPHLSTPCGDRTPLLRQIQTQKESRTEPLDFCTACAQSFLPALVGNSLDRSFITRTTQPSISGTRVYNAAWVDIIALSPITHTLLGIPQIPWTARFVCYRGPISQTTPRSQSGLRRTYTIEYTTTTVRIGSKHESVTSRRPAKAKGQKLLPRYTSLGAQSNPAEDPLDSETNDLQQRHDHLNFGISRQSSFPSYNFRTKDRKEIQPYQEYFVQLVSGSKSKFDSLNLIS